MKYFSRVIRGLCAGIILFVVSYYVALAIGNSMYPQKIDMMLISKEIGTFSYSRFVHDNAMPMIFLTTVSIFTVVYVALYLYLRHRYYKKLNQASR